MSIHDQCGHSYWQGHLAPSQDRLEIGWDTVPQVFPVILIVYQKNI